MKVIESDGFVSRARRKLQRRLRSPLDCRSISVPGGGLPGWPILSAAASICCSSLLRPPRLDADGMHEHCDIQARALRTSSRCASADASLPDRGSWSVPAYLPRRRWPASAVSPSPGPAAPGALPQVDSPDSKALPAGRKPPGQAPHQVCRGQQRWRGLRLCCCPHQGCGESQLFLHPWIAVPSRATPSSIFSTSAVAKLSLKVDTSGALA